MSLGVDMSSRGGGVGLLATWNTNERKVSGKRQEPMPLVLGHEGSVRRSPVYSRMISCGFLVAWISLSVSAFRCGGHRENW